MRKLLFSLLITCGLLAQAQVYNNEWIDFNKTYFKFKVSKNGLYRITQSTLAAAGLGSTPAEYFQLWRNGVQVPIYTSVASGNFSGSDYLEFWGQMNDGKPDRELYRQPQFQLNDKWSLISDTASYFLTVNPAVASNLRLQATANNVAGNTLPAEPYFLHTEGRYFKNKINPGFAYNVEENLYSSAYDEGEGWTSYDIATSYSGTTGFTYGSLRDTLQNLFPYSSGPSPKFKIAVSGNSFNDRSYRVLLNGDSLLGNRIFEMEARTDSAVFSSSKITSGSAIVNVTNLTLCTNPPTCFVIDRMVVHKYELTYARQFNFGGATNFEFTLPASATGNFLQISGFNFGSTAPVLYDLTNGKRYVADISAAPFLKIVLQPSATARRLVLVSEEAANVNAVTSLQSRNFINYNTAANRGDFLIISNDVLYGNGGANPVEDYRLYRSTAAGGSYNAKTYSSDALVDQFGFGINKNPAGIRNFIRFARIVFPQTPKYVFIIGKGINYVDQRGIEIANDPTVVANAAKLNLVPTFGWPASDNLLAAEPGNFKQEIPIGRLSAITAAEVAVYLKKMKEYELAQKTFSPKLEDRNWMKNVVHIVGAGSAGLDALLSNYMSNYEQIIRDTLFGAKVTTFRKTTAQTGDQLTNAYLTYLFNQGISLITYFGHSSASTLEFNLDNPENYNNPGKYPLFVGLGCNAGDFFKYNPARLIEKETISEKYVLAQDRGTIGFIASTHFGEVSHLNSWTNYLYNRISRTDYGNSIGEIMKKVVDDVNMGAPNDFLARANLEETELHGDPSMKLNTHPKPDYIIEDQTVKISPSFISIADQSFNVQVKMYNNGKAIDRDIVVEAKRQVGSNAATVVFRKTIPGIRYADSVSFNVPIDAARDKGANKIIVTVDADNVVDEMYETNNSVTKDVMIFEDEARPVYPYNFAIINKQNIKLIASTANPLSAAKQYRMELDTTELFNSSFKVTRNITAPGGLLEFDPGITYTDNTVYYWRVAVVPPTGPVTNWNAASFVFLAGSDVGFNQSHLYQHLKSTTENIHLDSASRKWLYNQQQHDIFARNTIYPYGSTQEGDFVVSVDGDPYIRSACVGHSLIYNVFDPNTFKPWLNVDANGNNLYRYGSGSANCQSGRQYNFEFSYMTPAGRKLMMDFMDSIPNGAYVVIRSTDFDTPNSYSSTWRSDTALYGTNKSLYHSLQRAGFTLIDSVNAPKSWILIYQKGTTAFQPKSAVSVGLYDKVTASAEVLTSGSEGYITSPVFGPSKGWKELRWNGSSLETPSFDNPTVAVIGIRFDGRADTLIRNLNLSQQTVSLASISATQYPYVQLRMRNVDSVNYSPYQLKYWRITYLPAPEGAVAPNILFSKKDTIGVGETLDFKVAFKNISEAAFDSVKIKLVVTDKNNVQHVIAPFKLRPLPGSDTLHVRYPIDSRLFGGQNTLYVEVNPDNDQPEQYHFNNFLSTSFYVVADTLSPLLDVTFDNVHILNHDIVSSKPTIVIKLKDESKFLISDPSTVTVQVKYPNGTISTFAPGTDTLRFVPAGVPGDNTATVIFNPAFFQDGEYELIVSGKDMSNNQAGNIQYRVAFQVINKAMISNLLNYPNPFTTSTAFVFTLTGSEVPQNMKIQILTVTGKVVREITKDELGPIRIGRNITEFKWDGTDQYGQKLGNGVYLYRVITNLKGASLEKYTGKDENTDKFFTKGYGKMYLMR